MPLQAIGVSLPAAIAIAISPFPVIGIILVLHGERGRSSGVAFTMGWLLGLSALTTSAVLLFEGAGDEESATSAIADWGRVVAGTGLFWLAVRKWRGRRDATAAGPAWMQSLESADPGRAFVLGAALATANPKNIVLVGAAAASMGETGVSGAEQVIAAGVFVLLASTSVIGAVLVELLGGSTGARVVDGVRRFMVANSHAITLVILVILGAHVLGNGLEGLGG